MGKDNTKEKQEPGLDLKSIREEKGLTLPEISEQTRISLSVLDLVENEKYESLPEPVYTRAFIKAYAGALDIDDKEILARYNSYIEAIESSREQVIVEKISQKSKVRNRVLVSIVVAILAVFILFIITRSYKTEPVKTTTAPMSQEVRPDTQQQPATPVDPQSEPRDVSRHSEPEDIGSGTVDADEQKQPEAARVETPIRDETGEQATVQMDGSAAIQEPYVLEIEAIELTWVKIIEDYNDPVEFMLKPGEKTLRKASKKFIVYIGNAGGVNVTFQGESLGPLGEPGKVIRLILPRKEEND